MRSRAKPTPEYSAQARVNLHALMIASGAKRPGLPRNPGYGCNHHPAQRRPTWVRSLTRAIFRRRIVAAEGGEAVPAYGSVPVRDVYRVWLGFGLCVQLNFMQLGRRCSRHDRRTGARPRCPRNVGMDREPRCQIARPTRDHARIPADRRLNPDARWSCEAAADRRYPCPETGARPAGTGMARSRKSRCRHPRRRLGNARTARRAGIQGRSTSRLLGKQRRTRTPGTPAGTSRRDVSWCAFHRCA